MADILQLVGLNLLYIRLACITVPYILVYKPTVFGWILMLKLWGLAYMRITPHSRSKLNIQHHCYISMTLTLCVPHMAWTIHRSPNLQECMEKWAPPQLTLPRIHVGRGRPHTDCCCCCIAVKSDIVTSHQFFTLRRPFKIIQLSAGVPMFVSN